MPASWLELAHWLKQAARVPNIIMCKLQARLLSADTCCALQVWRWGQQYRASVIQASDVALGAACQNNFGHPLGQYSIASLPCPAHAHRCTPSSKVLRSSSLLCAGRAHARDAAAARLVGGTHPDHRPRRLGYSHLSWRLQASKHEGLRDLCSHRSAATAALCLPLVP